MKIADEREDLLARARVEIAGRFVGEEDWRIDRQRAGNRDALTFAARELVGKMVHARLELNEREQLAGALFDFLARPSAQVQREADVFERRQRRQQVEELEDESDLVAAHPRQVVVGEAGERLAVDAHTAGGRTVESADEIEERRLARSGGSDDRDHLAARDRDAHIVEGGDAALAGELLGDVLERDHVRRGDAHAKLCEHVHKAVKLTRNSADSIVDRPQRDGWCGRARRPSDASGAAESNRHGAAVVDDHRNRAAPLAVTEHPLQLRRIFLDVDVLERHVPPLMVLPGGLRIRSRVLAEDVDHRHIVPLGQRLAVLEASRSSRRCRASLSGEPCARPASHSLG